MRWLDVLIARLRPLLRRSRIENELDAELRFHLDQLIEENRRFGMGAAEARRAALRAIGGIASIKDECRESLGLRTLDGLRQDGRSACRALLKHPGFTIVAVLILAVGIGATTAIFTVADALVFRPAPFACADRLYWIWDVNDTQHASVGDTVGPSPANFLDWRQQSRSFEYLVAWRNWFFSVAGPDGAGRAAEQVRGVNVSPNFFDMLGTQAALGRTFRPEEEEPAHHHVVVLTHGFWQRRFGGDPHIVGRAVRIDGQPFSVVGVLPPDFFFLWSDSAIFMPMPVDGPFRSARASHSVAVLARLAAGTTQRDAQSELDQLTRDLERAYPATNAGWRAGLVPVFPLNKQLRPGLILLLGAVGGVLLIACLNVTSLLLVRAGVRQRELAIRASLGATRARLMRQLLTESTILAGAGALFGVLVGQAIVRMLMPLLPQVQITRTLTLALNPRVLSFMIATTCLTAVALGVWPALRGSRMQDLRTAAVSGHRATAGRALVAIEIALSLMLVIAATSLVRSLWHLQQVDPGFRAQHLLTMQLWLPPDTYETPTRVTGFYREILHRLRRFSGVQGATVVNIRPFLGWGLGARVVIPGRRQQADDPVIGFRVIGPDYLTVLGTPLLRGRPLDETDGPHSRGVTLINDIMARRFWPTEDPIGQTIRIEPLGAPGTAPWWPVQETNAFTIVGVVGNVRESRLGEQVEPLVYVSYLQNASRYAHLLVRTTSQPTSVISLVQREVHAVDPDLGAYGVQPMETVLGQAVAEPRLNSVVLWAFATLALALSAVGIYGVTSYAVAQRTREFALRMAIGANSRAVFRLVIRDALAVTMCGIGLGLVSATLLVRTIASLLYGVRPMDASTFGGAVIVVFVVESLAWWRPARRATIVDPITVLRAE